MLGVDKARFEQRSGLVLLHKLGNVDSVRVHGPDVGHLLLFSQLHAEVHCGKESVAGYSITGSKVVNKVQDDSLAL